MHAQADSVPELQELMEKFDTTVVLGAGAVCQAGVNELNIKYKAALKRLIETAQGTGKLDEALAYKKEISTVEEAGAIVADDDANLPASLKNLRSVYRQSSVKLYSDQIVAIAPLAKDLSKSIDQLIATLTKAGRLEEVLSVKKKKEMLTHDIEKKYKSVPTAKKTDFTNSLGMKFVKIAGVKVLFCIHETRRMDYAAFAGEVPGVVEGWKNMLRDGVPVGDKGDHPVVGASWEDANAFCAWLSQKEGKIYRLPTDREWSVAVGIEQDEKWDKETDPAIRSGVLIDIFPWGGKYPPRTDEEAGNYADTAFHDKYPKEPFLGDYTDGFATTAPVMSFKALKNGLFDMGGNVWEWCEDVYRPRSTDRVLRGGCFLNNTALNLLSSFRLDRTVAHRTVILGFRCVLEDGR